MASVLNLSMAAKSFLNMSGCWSYLDDMYCFIAEVRDNGRAFLKGISRMFELQAMKLV